MDTLVGQFSYSINRALEFVVDRMWVDILTLAMLLWLPERNRASFSSELVYAVLATLVLFVLREQFLRPHSDHDAMLMQQIVDKNKMKEGASV